MWSNDYIHGKRQEDFIKYFTQNIESLQQDIRYLNNEHVKNLCEKYKLLLQLDFLFNKENSGYTIGEVYTEYADNPCIGRTEYEIKEIKSNGDHYGIIIYSNVRDLEIHDVI